MNPVRRGSRACAVRLALEGLPYLIDALAVTVEAALRKFVRSAQPALQTADLRLPRSTARAYQV